MALPRVFPATLKRKTTMNDGNILLTFAPKVENDVARAQGLAQFIVASAVADDFVVDTEYTLTATAGD